MSTECLFLALMAFAGGLALGGICKDAQWREKARDGFRMASGGRLFVVREYEKEGEQ
jgi:hypothetical protein